MNSVKSAGGFLGLSDGPKAPDGQFGNAGLGALSGQNELYHSADPALRMAMDRVTDYGLGKDLSAESVLADRGISSVHKTELANALATGPLSGTRFATEQVQNNEILGSLFGKEGQLNKQSDILDKLQNQGFELTPEDRTAYGQTSGDIARLFGQQGNQIAADLSARGLSSGPTGAASAMFSGLAGNRNEMLAKAQQNIMQQRYQNTMQQIGQQQNFISQLGAQGANAINQQYGRQLAGAQNQKAGLTQAAGLQQNANNAQSQQQMQAAQFEQANKPQNWFDMLQGGANAALGSGGKTAGQGAAGSMFGGQQGSLAAMGAG
jgi:hypothetical protein